MYNTSQPTVRGWLKHYNIPRKDHATASKEANNRNQLAQKPSREVLQRELNLYSIDALEKMYGVGQTTLYKWIVDYALLIPAHNDKVRISKERALYDRVDIEKMLCSYTNAQNISTTADEHQISYSLCRKLLHRHGVRVTTSKITKRHREIVSFCEEYDLKYTLNDRSVISPLEVDMIIEDTLAIEFNGLYWHCELFKDRNYHKNKTQTLVSLGYRTLQVFEHYDLDIIKSMILHRLGRSARIYARKLKVVSVESSLQRNFEDANHLMGYRPSTLCYGLVNESGQLLQTMSFMKSRYNTKYQWEIIRACTARNTNIVGGVSKLFAAFVRTHNPLTVISYADRTYGEGDVYKLLGMTLTHTTQPNYYYFKPSDATKVFSRIKFQKHKLAKHLANFDANLSEVENMYNHGWLRYWDCGNNVYCLDLK